MSDVKPVPRRLVYISRKFNKNRHFLNDEEVESLLSELGFDVDIVAYENMSIMEGLVRTRQASVIFGIHGAG